MNGVYGEGGWSVKRSTTRKEGGLTIKQHLGFLPSHLDSLYSAGDHNWDNNRYVESMQPTVRNSDRPRTIPNDIRPWVASYRLIRLILYLSCASCRSSKIDHDSKSDDG
jgi:hypothetical protein